MLPKFRLRPNLSEPHFSPIACPLYKRDEGQLEVTEGILESSSMHALHQEIHPPSGVEFATSLKLTPSTLGTLPTPPNATIRHEFTARTLCNVVVARSNLLRIFEVRQEQAPISSQADDQRERAAKVRKGTEAVEGEVEMDDQGEGFINIDKVILTFNVFIIRVLQCEFFI